MSWPLFALLVILFTFLLAGTGFAWLVEAIFRLAQKAIWLGVATTIVVLLYRGIRGIFRSTASGLRRLFTPSGRRTNSSATAGHGGAAQAARPDAAARPQPARRKNIVRRRS